MLIACISDIHGNLAALQAAVADAREKGAETIIAAGDLVGYGPCPNEVCSYLEDNGIEAIRGNYDDKVLDVAVNGKSAVASLQKKKKKLVIWTAENIKKKTVQYLEKLPETREIALPGERTMLVVHGSPLSNDDDILPSITAGGLKAKMGDLQPDILVCGHTHIPFVKRTGSVTIVNCGSTGMPVDGDPMPSYAFISCDPDKMHCHIVRFEYDIVETVSALKKTTLPKKLRKDFMEGTKRRFLQ